MSPSISKAIKKCFDSISDEDLKTIAGPHGYSNTQLPRNYSYGEAYLQEEEDSEDVFVCVGGRYKLEKDGRADRGTEDRNYRAIEKQRLMRFLYADGTWHMKSISVKYDYNRRTKVETVLDSWDKKTETIDIQSVSVEKKKQNVKEAIDKCPEKTPRIGTVEYLWNFFRNYHNADQQRYLDENKWYCDLLFWPRSSHNTKGAGKLPEDFGKTWEV